jgi:hypothetical protein
MAADGPPGAPPRLAFGAAVAYAVVWLMPALLEDVSAPITVVAAATGSVIAGAVIRRWAAPSLGLCALSLLLHGGCERARDGDFISVDCRSPSDPAIVVVAVAACALAIAVGVAAGRRIPATARNRR